MHRTRAAEEFAKALYGTGVVETVPAIYDGLQHPTGYQKARWEQARDWLARQDEEAAEVVRFLIQETAIMATFGLVAMFDGDAGYHWVDEQPGEFAVSLRLYRNADDLPLNDPVEEVTVCPISGGVDIHDLFLNVVDEGRFWTLS